MDARAEELVKRQRAWVRCFVGITLGGMLAGCLYPEVPDVFDAGDSGSVSDAGDDAPVVPVFNRCTLARYVDRSDEGADRRVGFGGALGSDVFFYSPACIEIAAGQSVTFVGPFDSHPLGHGTGPADESAGSPNTPIVETRSGSMATMNFPTPGVYPFFCYNHYASGMAGAVWVR